MSLPPHSMVCFDSIDALPDPVERFFAGELAESRRVRASNVPYAERWRSICVCAIDADGNVMGGMYADVGPITFGPVASDTLAYLEQCLVFPAYRRRGLGTTLLGALVDLARDAGCAYIRCCADWHNAAEIALYRRCGFALVCIEDGDYICVKSLAAPATPFAPLASTHSIGTR